MRRGEIRTIADLSRATGLSQQELANLGGMSKSLVSLVANEKYDNWQLFVDRLVRRCVEANRLVLEDFDPAASASDAPQITIDNSVFIRTDNVLRLHALCDDLLDEDTSLNSSIGMATGRAGYGKTTAIRRYISGNDSAVYVLWMNYSRPQLFQRIAEELIGRSYNSYIRNVKLICELTRAYRRLIVIDEADRMPVPILEDLRTLNEEGQVPLLLLGEDALAAKVKKADRIESRIRKPVVTFRQLDWIDLKAYYQESTGLELEKDVAVRLVQDAHRDFRIAANDMQAIVKLMNANGMRELTREVLDAIRRAR